MSFPSDRILPAAWVLLAAGATQAFGQDVQVRNFSGQDMEIERLEEGEAGHSIQAILLPSGGAQGTRFEFPAGKDRRPLPNGRTLILRYKSLPEKFEPTTSRTASFRIIDGHGNPRTFHFTLWTQAPAGAGSGPEIATSLTLDSASGETKGTPAWFSAKDNTLTLTPASEAGQTAPGPGEFLVINRSGAELRITPAKDGETAGPVMAGTLELAGEAKGKPMELSAAAPAPVTLGKDARLRLRFKQTPSEADQPSLTGKFLVGDGHGGDAALFCTVWESTQETSLGPAPKLEASLTVEGAQAATETKGTARRFITDGATLTILPR